MANLSNAMQQVLLNAINRGTPTTFAPIGSICLALLTASPGLGSPLVGEITAAAGYGRTAVSWGAAVGPPYSAYNLQAMTFGPLSTVPPVVAVAVMDTSAGPNLGNPLWVGTLATPRTPLVGDSIVVAASALTSLIA
jgi:hypothetical protein